MASTRKRREPGNGIHTRVRKGEPEKQTASRARRKAAERSEIYGPVEPEPAEDPPTKRSGVADDWRFR